MRRVSFVGRADRCPPSRFPDAQEESAKTSAETLPPANGRFPRDEGDAATENASPQNPEIPRIAGTSSGGTPVYQL